MCGMERIIGFARCACGSELSAVWHGSRGGECGVYLRFGAVSGDDDR